MLVIQNVEIINLGLHDRVDLTGWRWPNFTPLEMRQRSDGLVFIVPEFLDTIQRLRDRVGLPLPVSSYYRGAKYNIQVSSTGPDGPHTTGLAIDLLCFGKTAHEVLRVAFDMGFTGIGASQKGPQAERFIHLDTLTEGSRPWVWSY